MNSKVKVSLSDAGLRPKMVEFPTQEHARKELQHSQYTCAVVSDVAGRVISIWHRDLAETWSYRDIGIQQR